MFKVQFKTKNPFESWTTLGRYGTEEQAISAAMGKKSKGALLVRVTDKNGAVVYTG
jgi:hypothetical protein